MQCSKRVLMEKTDVEEDDRVFYDIQSQLHEILLAHIPVLNVVKIVREYELSSLELKVDSIGHGAVDGVVLCGVEVMQPFDFTTTILNYLPEDMKKPFCDSVKTYQSRFPVPASPPPPRPGFHLGEIPKSAIPPSYSALSRDTFPRVRQECQDLCFLPRTRGDLKGHIIATPLSATSMVIRMDSIVNPEVWFEMQLQQRADKSWHIHRSFWVPGRLSTRNSFLKAQVQADNSTVMVTDKVNPCWASFTIPSVTMVRLPENKVRKTGFDRNYRK